MEKTIVVSFKDAEQEEKFLSELTSMVFACGASAIETYDTPLEAFSHAEGPFRIRQLIENDILGCINDKDLIKEMGEAAEFEIKENLLGERDTYPSILDNDVLERIAIDSVITVLQNRLSKLDDLNRRMADTFLADYAD